MPSSSHNQVADRILIVDDEAEVCKVLSERLSLEDYSCTTAHDGKEALYCLYKENFSLMLSDIKMPEMDGLDLLKKAMTLDPHMKVVMMTGYAEVETVVKALHLGAYDFILKPFDFNLVVFSVRRALEKKRMEEMVADYDQHLEQLVGQRTAKLQAAYGMLKKAHLDSIKMLVEAIDAKDPYTRGHSERVRKWSVQMAVKLNFNEKKMESLEFGALLHDIGMIGIKDAVLHKPGNLDPAEYEHIQEHPLIGAKIVEGTSFFKDIIPTIRHHHERFDGSGYPDRLAGEQIPFEAKMISIVDAFDAMTSLRPHRPEMPLQGALVELEKSKGKQFDPHILEVFMKEKIYRS